MLNEDLITPDHQNEYDWKYIVTDGEYVTGLFSSLDYVLGKMEPIDRFNLLSVVIRPETDCSSIHLDGYDFIGYELLDKDYDISALSNCGGFDETFLPSELNHFGLIADYEKAVDICKRLAANNPDEHHADTNVIAVWRHQTIGKAQG